MEKKLWFRRKSYGWGWTPSTWQGWLVIAVYVLFDFIFIERIKKESTPSDIIFGFFLPILITTTLLIYIAYKKGEKPRWQWGNKKEI